LEKDDRPRGPSRAPRCAPDTRGILEVDDLKRELDLGTPLLVVFIIAQPLIINFASLWDTIILRWCFLLSVSGLALAMGLKKRIFSRSTCTLPLVVFLLLVLVSALLSEHRKEAFIGAGSRLTGFVSWACFVVLFLFAAGLAAQKPRTLDRVTGPVWRVSVAVIAVLGLLQYFGIDLVGVISPTYNLSYGTIGNSNHLGTYLLTCPLPFVVNRYLAGPTVATTAELALVYGCLLTTQSKSAWIALAFGILVILWKHPLRKNLIKMLVVMVIATAALIPFRGLVLWQEAMSLELHAKLALEGNPEAGNFRFFLWQEGLKALPKYALFGIGPDSYLYVAKDALERHFGENYPARAHNIYLETAVTMGLPALLAYLWFLLCCLRRFDPKDAGQFTFFLMLAIYLVQGLFLNDVLSVYPVFLTLLAVGVGATSARPAPNMEKHGPRELKRFP
jgi:putative inorganic carbon (HCO3(-)) transporter